MLLLELIAKLPENQAHSPLQTGTDKSPRDQLRKPNPRLQLQSQPMELDPRTLIGRPGTIGDLLDASIGCRGDTVQAPHLFSLSDPGSAVDTVQRGQFLI